SFFSSFFTLEVGTPPVGTPTAKTPSKPVSRTHGRGVVFFGSESATGVDHREQPCAADHGRASAPGGARPCLAGWSGRECSPKRPDRTRRIAGRWDGHIVRGTNLKKEIEMGNP